MKTVVVTGTTSGIGYETARGILQRGDHLIAINRSPSKWEQCCVRLKQEFPQAKISSFVADLASMYQIQSVCSEIIKNHPIIDVLINNAGIYLAQKEMSEDGWEKTFAVNHMAYVAICEHFIDAVQKSEEGRIVQVASRAHWYAKQKLSLATANTSRLPHFRRSTHRKDFHFFIVFTTPLQQIIISN